MFVYAFSKKSNSLIRAITVSNQHLTVYTATNDNNEMNSMIEACGLNGHRGWFANFPGHIFHHQPFPIKEFPGKESKNQHRHFEFTQEDRLAQLAQYCHMLVDRQSDFAFREESLQAAKEQCEQDRIKAKDEVLPERLQKMLEDFDTTTPFIPEDEVDDLLEKFSDYIAESDQNLHGIIDRISFFAENLQKKNWSAIYNMSRHGVVNSRQDEMIVDLYHKMLDLRRLGLMAINHQELNYEKFKLLNVVIYDIQSNAEFKKIPDYEQKQLQLSKIASLVLDEMPAAIKDKILLYNAITVGALYVILGSSVAVACAFGFGLSIPSVMLLATVGNMFSFGYTKNGRFLLDYCKRQMLDSTETIHEVLEPPVTEEASQMHAAIVTMNQPAGFLPQAERKLYSNEIMIDNITERADYDNGHVNQRTVLS